MNDPQYVNILKVHGVINRIKKGKGEIIKIDELAFVPEESMELWHKRGYKPNPIGICIVKYPHGDKPDKEYIFPLEWEVKKSAYKQHLERCKEANKHESEGCTA